MSFQIKNSEHKKNKNYVQKLAHDFELLDVWEFPICFNPSENDNLYLFRKIAVEPTFKNVFNNSLTGFFFKFRIYVGKIFKLDENVNKLPIPDSLEYNLTDRMSNEDKKQHSPELNIEIRANNYLDFRTVYSFEDETLNEISNASEHALMHYSWIKKGKCFKVQLASYVKHRSKFSHIYIKLIDPFKRKIVYPYLFNQFVKRWETYKNNQK